MIYVTDQVIFYSVFLQHWEDGNVTHLVVLTED